MTEAADELASLVNQLTQGNATTESASDLANLAADLSDAELTADPNCPSLAQALWDSLDHLQQTHPAAAFTGFDSIKPADAAEPQT